MQTQTYPSDCLDERRKRLRQAINVCGLDFVDVCPEAGHAKRRIRVHFLGQMPSWLTNDSFILCRDGSEHSISVELVKPDPKQHRHHSHSISIEVNEEVCLDGEYSLTIRQPDLIVTANPASTDASKAPIGHYFESGDLNKHSAYRRSDGDYWIWHDEKEEWILSKTRGHQGQDYWSSSSGLLGDYEANGSVKCQSNVASATPVVDPFFSCVTFRFDSHAPAKVDCRQSEAIQAPAASSPDINYLAKDYATFRQLMLDRLAVTMPDWQEHCPADIGVMLVEILAYSADHLSYYQDAVATEAYLGTSRLRQSLRRHARLVDYRVHEGCNSRAWVHLKVTDDVVVENAKDLFFVSLPNSSPAMRLTPFSKPTLDELLHRQPGCQVFEPVVSKEFAFWKSHNTCTIHDWGGARPCLPRGATSAYLVNRSKQTVLDGAKAGKEGDQATSPVRPNERDSLQLRKGDVLILEEVRSPWTGAHADADPSHRHAVRITEVQYEHADDLHHNNDKFSRLPLVKVSWDEEDALPFTLWIAKPHDAHWKSQEHGPISVALGNNLLVDHGHSLVHDDITLQKTWEEPVGRENTNYPSPGITAKLTSANLTFSDRLAKSQASAAAQLVQNPRRATPQVVLQVASKARKLVGEFSILELNDLRRIAKRLLAKMNFDAATSEGSYLVGASYYAKQVYHACGCSKETASETPLVDLAKLRDAIKDDLRDVWLPLYDLIDCGPDDARFVVEMSDDRTANLRFGKRGFGRTPDLKKDTSQSTMVANFRVGNGQSGNVPAESIQLFGSYGNPVIDIESVRNPLPALGGIDPESTKQIRLFAPHAIRSDLRRAITPEDYEKIAMREFKQHLQRVKVTFVWTGHEFEVLVAVDAKGREVASRDLLDRIRDALHPYRRIGHSVRVRVAERVVPTLELTVCLKSHVHKEQIQGELDLFFSDQVLSDGSLAFFHPDQLTFGEGVYVSQIVAAAKCVLGKRSVNISVTKLHRSDEGPANELEDEFLPLRSQEIVRFDNNQNHPEFGKLLLIIKGGQQT